MNVVPGVEEAARCNGDVLHLVAVEGELELEVDCCCSSVTLGEHGMLFYHPLESATNVHCVQIPVELVEIIFCLEFLLIILMAVV